MTHFITHTIEPWMPPGALKAKSDYATIARHDGWHELSLYRYNDARFSEDTLVKNIGDWLESLHTGDFVLHQFPTYMSANFESQFVSALKQRHIRRAVLIHDIEPLRLLKENAWEFEVLAQYDIVIVHSKAMQERLQQAGVKSAFIIQPLFDYLSPDQPPAKFSHNINFAGTFQKSPWLQDYVGTTLTLFGSKPKKWRDFNFPKDIHYQGNFDPETIVTHLNDGFGLIWDSDFDDKTYQTYTIYNTPHKASLYLRAGLPLISWTNSAIGQFIVKHQIGFTITNLTELNIRLNQIDRAQYQVWQNNMEKIAKDVGEGNYTRNTLHQLL